MLIIGRGVRGRSCGTVQSHAAETLHEMLKKMGWTTGLCWATLTGAKKLTGWTMSPSNTGGFRRARSSQWTITRMLTHPQQQSWTPQRRRHIETQEQRGIRKVDIFHYSTLICQSYWCWPIKSLWKFDWFKKAVTKAVRQTKIMLLSAKKAFCIPRPSSK